MTCWAVIPLRASPESKSRLAGVLDAPARAALVDAMLAQVLDAALGARNVSRVCLMGTSRTTLPDDVTVLAEPGGGLNAAAAAALAQTEASRLVIIHADLPQVSAQDLELLAATPEGTIAIAPDRHGTGTNAISLPLPAAKGFSFAFGPDSLMQHTREAARLGFNVQTVISPGLAKDIDVPADLRDADAWRTGYL